MFWPTFVPTKASPKRRPGGESDRSIGPRELGKSSLAVVEGWFGDWLSGGGLDQAPKCGVCLAHSTDTSYNRLC